jgi:hypothetical protein
MRGPDSRAKGSFDPVAGAIHAGAALPRTDATVPETPFHSDANRILT